jgi:K+ transporter
MNKIIAKGISMSKKNLKNQMNKSVIQKVTAASLLDALGIIYGDIGTSPLYVMKAIVGQREISKLFTDW